MMKRITLLLQVILLLSIATISAQIQKDKNHYIEYSDWSKLKQHKIPEWFKDAKFGYKDFIPMFKADKFDAALQKRRW